MPNIKKNYPKLSDMRAASPLFFNKSNRSFFKDQKYRAYHGYLIIEGIVPHSNGTKSRSVAVWRFAPELSNKDKQPGYPENALYHVTLSSDTRNIDKVKELIGEYEKNEWPTRAARIAEGLKNQN
jgi:hypothetical protein